MGDEMMCQKFRELIDDYIDDVLSYEERAFMKAHAEKCENCAEEMRLADIIKNEVKGMDNHIAVPLEAQAAWRSAVRKEIRNKKLKKAYKAVGSIAAAFVVLVGATFAMRSTGALPPKFEKAPENSEPAMVMKLTADTEMAVKTYQTSESMQRSRSINGESEIVIEADGETDDLIVGSVDDADIIKSAQIVTETENIDMDIQAVYDLTEEYEGYVSEDIRDFSSFGGHADIVSRIPQDQMDDYIQAAENIGTIVSVSRFSQNAEEIYYDIDNRLESKKLLAEEINRAIAQADEEMLLTLNDEINQVYDEIDALIRIANTRDNDLMYARVKISLIEKAPAAVTPSEYSLKERTASGFMQSLTAIGDFLKDMAVAVSVIAPVVLLLAACALIVFFTAKSVKKNKKKKKEDGDE